MTHATIDSLPVSQLPERYGIVRSVVYTRLSDLHIKPEKRGNKSYVNADDLALLDALHQFIQQGGTTAEFLDQQGLNQPPAEPDTHLVYAPTPAPDSTGLTLMLMEAMAQRMAPPPDPLANLKALEDAYQHHWHLSTSQLAALLGRKTLSGQQIQRYGFMFTRVGRNGAESAWAVEKESS